MSLNYADEPDNAPTDAQFYGIETARFVAGWYRYHHGQWYWSDEDHGSEAKWEEVSIHGIPTLGTDIFITKKYPLEALKPDAEYLHAPIPNVQLRREEDSGYVQYPYKTQWEKLPGNLNDDWWEYQIPLANLGWKPRSPSSVSTPTPENDVDNW